jgi:nucleotide-binding universal stress UspA family protein
MRLRQILCPIDFSDVSAEALLQASRLARWHGARLAVLHVRPTVTPHPDLPADGSPPAPWLAAELDASRDRIAAMCREMPPGVEASPVVTAGNPVDEILRTTASLAADLIVIATHGTSGFRHLVLGSVTEKVLRQATCPVLTVPPRAQAVAERFTRIVCAVDFSDCSLAAARFAASLATEAGAVLTLLHVVDWPWHEAAATAAVPGVPAAEAQTIDEYRRYLEAGAAQRLHAVAESLGTTGRTATTVRFGKPYVELLDAARAEGADLIVLGVHGRGTIDLGFFGSTANHVVRSAACPVLTVRTDGG